MCYGWTVHSCVDNQCGKRVVRQVGTRISQVEINHPGLTTEDTIISVLRPRTQVSRVSEV
jgi:hypothetical protein